MIKRIRKLHIILFLLSIILIIIGLTSNHVSSINIYDTYYVFSTADIFYLISIITGFAGVIFWLISKRKTKNE